MNGLENWQRESCFTRTSSSFHVGEQNIARWCQIRIWRVINQTSSKPQSRTTAITTTDLCEGALSWWNRTVTPVVSFLSCSWNVASITFQSPELLIKCRYIWKETMQLVWGKFEFNACQVSVLVAQLLLSKPMNFSAQPCM